ncbi:MAG: DUF4375 domain-containing protein [Bacilli bacterium]
MYYSYLVGINQCIGLKFSIKNLEKQGIVVNKFNDDYQVSIPKEKIKIYEKFIQKYLKKGYWNEYISNKDNQIVFLFKQTTKKVEKVILNENNESNILSKCNNLSKKNYQSIKKMLLEKDFYIFCNLIKLEKEDITNDLVKKYFLQNDIYKVIEPFVRDFVNEVDFQNDKNKALDYLNYLSLPQKKLYLISQYDLEISNGGHYDFYKSNFGILWKEILEVLKEFDLFDYFELLEDSINILKPKENYNELVEQMENTDKNIFDTLDNDFYNLAYIMTNDKIIKYIENSLDELTYND